MKYFHTHTHARPHTHKPTHTHTHAQAHTYIHVSQLPIVVLVENQGIPPLYTPKLTFESLFSNENL